jgi:hypothetical protein
MCCRGLHRDAIPAYLSRLLFSGLPSVAQYCVPGGIRVVSEASVWRRSNPRARGERVGRHSLRGEFAGIILSW